MSLARQLFHEFRPLFRVLEDPFMHHGKFPASSRFQRQFDNQFWNETGGSWARPAMDLSEEGNNYVVEAELPGVKKENVEVKVGDGGRSLTIEGKIVKSPGTTSETAVATNEQTQQISTERSFSGATTFTRTVWLPRAIDSTGVKARLEDGVLTVRIPKAAEQGAVKVQVD